MPRKYNYIYKQLVEDRGETSSDILLMLCIKKIKSNTLINLKKSIITMSQQKMI